MTERWTMTVPVLSTEHIKPDTELWLAKEAQKSTYLVVRLLEGWLVSLDQYECDDVPADLRHVMRHLVDLDEALCWVRFDRDGDVWPELPTYGWK